MTFNQTPDDLFVFFDKIGAEISIYRNPQSWMQNKPWFCRITLKRHNAELSVKSEAESAQIAMLNAYDEFRDLARTIDL
jgi:hypothetical protein